jgi:hypothetical protein
VIETSLEVQHPVIRGKGRCYVQRKHKYGARKPSTTKVQQSYLPQTSPPSLHAWSWISILTPGRAEEHLY